MDSAAQAIAEIVAKAPREILASSTTTSLLDLRIDAYNAMPGPPGAEPCPECKGKGYCAVNSDGSLAMRECSCMTRRRCLARIRRSGLGELYERYTLDTFTTLKPWQRHLKGKALEYIKGASGWFFVCGRTGSGKSHITAGIARELIEAGMETRYFMWRQDAPRLKALVNDRAEYEVAMKDFIECRVLLIADLWKGGNVTEADVSLTFELLNARYNTPSKLTLIFTEKTVNQILTIDEAVGGRICERAKGFTLKTADENLRLQGV